MTERTGPLSRFTVLDLTRVRSGPTAVRQFADWGADVIKIEAPEKIDPSKGMGGSRDGPDFQNIHRNKRGITLNMKDPDGLAVFKRLVEKADVVVENFRPDVKNRLGIDYQSLKAINPGIVLASISGFGQDGPYAYRPALDVIVQGMGGMLSITGEPGGGPVRPGASMGDITAALFTTVAIQSALLEREKSGEGQFIDISMLDCQVAIMENAFTRYFTFRHLQNGQLPCQSMQEFEEQHLAGYVAGLNKLVNSLSWEPKVRQVEPIAEGMAIYAIDIRDYGWTTRQWEALIGGRIPGLKEAQPYPYGMDPFGAGRDENLNQVAQITGTSVPVMRGDWFVAVVGEPFYYKFMLNLPDTAQEFEHTLLRLDRPGAIMRRDVLRAGFLEGGSGVSQNNRLIERIEQPNGGYYWVSYDFDRAVSADRRLKERPLGPHDAFPASQKVFDSDGGEMIFSLPNGMQGYYLTDGPGNFIPDGPTSVVFFKGESPVSGATISNGSACMTCHVNGPIEGYDQIRNAVENHGTDRVTMEAVRELYADDDTLRAAYAEDTNRYLDALAASGGDYSLPDGPGRYHHEPVTNTIARYFDELDKDLLAAEFGLPTGAVEETR